MFFSYAWTPLWKGVGGNTISHAEWVLGFSFFSVVCFLTFFFQFVLLLFFLLGRKVGEAADEAGRAPPLGRSLRRRR